MAHIIKSEKEFDEVLKSPAVIIDLYADWCGPCRMLAPTIEEVATELDGKVVVNKLNVDEVGDVAARYGVDTIPTLLFFLNGKLVTRRIGVRSKEAILVDVADFLTTK